MFVIILSQEPSIIKTFLVWLFLKLKYSHIRFFKNKDPITMSSHCIKRKTSNSRKMAFKRKLEHALKLIQIHTAPYKIPAKSALCTKIYTLFRSQI